MTEGFPTRAVGAGRGTKMAMGRKTTRIVPAGNAGTSTTPSSGDNAIPLRAHAELTLRAYFESLNGHRPSGLYQLVLREVEEPLFRAVLDYTEGNQMRAAEILGINRGTLRRKLEDYGLVD
jgi:Fis family transcriptional regulator